MPQTAFKSGQYRAKVASFVYLFVFGLDYWSDIVKSKGISKLISLANHNTGYVEGVNKSSRMDQKVSLILDLLFIYHTI